MKYRIYLVLLLQLTFGFSNEVSIVAIFRNEGHYLKEWVEYHRKLGVTHFRLYDNGSEDHSLDVLEPYVKSGLAKVIPWQKDAEKGKGPHYSYNFTGNQCNAYKDGIKALAGKSKWVALIDIDEFIVPMKEWDISKCLRRHFSNVDAIYVNWRNFGTSKKTVPKGKNIVPHLTRCSLKAHPRNGVGKTFLRPESCDVEKMHYPHHAVLYTGKTYVNANCEPIEHSGGHIKATGKHYDKFLRINHYALRDEDYFWNVRMKRNNYGYGGNELFKEHYQSFSLSSDKRILKIIARFQ